MVEAKKAGVDVHPKLTHLACHFSSSSGAPGVGTGCRRSRSRLKALLRGREPRSHHPTSSTTIRASTLSRNRSSRSTRRSSSSVVSWSSGTPSSAAVRSSRLPILPPVHRDQVVVDLQAGRIRPGCRPPRSAPSAAVCTSVKFRLRSMLTDSSAPATYRPVRRSGVSAGRRAGRRLTCLPSRSTCSVVPAVRAAQAVEQGALGGPVQRGAVHRRRSGRSAAGRMPAAAGASRATVSVGSSFSTKNVTPEVRRRRVLARRGAGPGCGTPAGPARRSWRSAPCRRRAGRC